MSTESEIRRAIATIAGQNGKANDMVFDAVVVAVDDETVTIEADGTQISDVRTCAAVDGDDDYLHIYPAVGSSVIVLDTDGTRRDLCVIGYSAIARLSLHGGTESVPNGTELKKQLDILSERVEHLYTALKNAAVDSSGGVQQAKLKIELETQTNKEDFSYIEDTTITH